MTWLLALLCAAAPVAKPPRIQGLDKPKKEQRATLGQSPTTEAKVKIRCVDVGASMLVEVNDPGLMGARAMWLEKKNGTTMLRRVRRSHGRAGVLAAHWRAALRR